MGGLWVHTIERAFFVLSCFLFVLFCLLCGGHSVNFCNSFRAILCVFRGFITGTIGGQRYGVQRPCVHRGYAYNNGQIGVIYGRRANKVLFRDTNAMGRRTTNNETCNLKRAGYLIWGQLSRGITIILIATFGLFVAGLRHRLGKYRNIGTFIYGGDFNDGNAKNGGSSFGLFRFCLPPFMVTFGVSSSIW